ncbi:hypothetical protein ACN95_10200 [Gordonia sihwensis]|uniref:hypothetical protein n=1 Tax=Gordonia sihwensis TaxID=173559 RepID=UPI001C930F8B|nr:hypothetical protein [Gordonia sihwensis]MBY4570388.1 hypothetical protein [Gordonia sihwensis]
MSTATDNRTLFACTWCGTEALSLDLDAEQIEQARTDWLAEHAHCRDEHQAARLGCDDCGQTWPGHEGVAHPSIVGLSTVSLGDYHAWLEHHECVSAETNRWQQLATASTDVLTTPETIVGVPRPSWSDPAEDHLTNGAWPCYQSAPVIVPTRQHTGERHVDGLDVAHIQTRVRQFGPSVGNLRGIQLRFRRMAADGEWFNNTWPLNLDEARRLAEVLIAGVDLAESEPIGSLPQ